MLIGMLFSMSLAQAQDVVPDACDTSTMRPTARTYCACLSKARKARTDSLYSGGTDYSDWWTGSR
jgi:hypothetical protein